MGTGVIGLVVVIAVSWILWRILKRAIGGCVSMGIGCLVLVAGVIAIALYLGSKSGITSFQDLLRAIGF